MDLPTGTVTFLFTDIEGSTRLLSELGDGYRDILERHHRILRDAIAAGGGQEVRTEGDAFFAVFPSAPGAVHAVAEAQRRFAEESWPLPLRVRMGLHTGEGKLGGGDYYGIDVHRAARIAAAGWGGQVLLSDPTAALASSRLPPGTSLRNLGLHRFKDLDEPERICELVIDGVTPELPPIRSLSATPNNLPAQTTTFVGREAEVRQVLDLLGSARLLTLTGPGGTGKTRLSLRVAAEALPDFPDGVYFVPLAPIADPHLVPSSIATALSIQAGADPTASVLEFLRTRRVLLVLDNFEQVLDAAAVVSRIVSEAPSVKVLTTSRAPLHLSGEQEYPVPPLDLPDGLASTSDPAELARVESVALFVERASAVRPDFTLDAGNAADVARIVARLDGLPLAIELAAARTRLFPPAEIARRLSSALSVLQGGPRDLPARQQTLRGAIAWSDQLLDPAVRLLLARMAVFVGGAELGMLERVCGPPEELGIEPLEGVEVLVDHSLVRADRANLRVWMLATIREYARERLEETGTVDEMSRRHAEAMLDLVEEAEPHLTAIEQVEWLDRLGREHDNLRAAIEWAVGAGEVDLAMRLVAAVWRFWQMRGHLLEARERVEELLALPGGETRNRARAVDAAGGIAYWQGDLDGVRTHYAESLRLWEETGDRAGIANALYNDAFKQIVAQDSEAARDALRRALSIYEEDGDRKGQAHVLWGFGVMELEAGDVDAAEGYFESSIPLAREVGDAFLEGWAHRMLGALYLRTRRWDEAERHLRASFEMFLAARDVSSVALHLRDFGVLAWARGDAERAARLIGAMAAAQRVSQSAITEFPMNQIEDWPAIVEEVGAERVEELLAEGAALDQEAAVALALGEAAVRPTTH